MDHRDLDTAPPVPDELDLAAQAQDEPGPGDSHEIDRLLAGRFFTIGTSGAISAWNSHCQAAFGYTEHGTSGQSFVDKLVAPSEREKRAEEVGALLANQGPPVALHIETCAVNAAGVEFDERFSVVPIRLHDGYHINGLVQDIAKNRREGDRERLLRTHATLLGVVHDELTGRVEAPAEGSEEEPAPLVGALVIFDGDRAPVVPGAGAEEADTPEDELEGARSELARLRVAYEQAQKEAEDARHDAELAREEVEQTRGRLTELRGSADEEQDRAAQLDAEMAELRAKVEAAEAALEEARAEQAEGSDETDALRRELEEARAARDEAAEKLGAMETELAELSSRGEDLASELDAKRSELSEVAARRDELAGKLDSTGEDLAELAARRGELAEELEERRAELTEVAGRRDELAAELDAKERELAETAKARDDLAAAVEAKEAEIESARTAESEQAEELRAELEAKQAELAEVTEARVELAARLAEKEAELADAATAHDELTASVDELAAARDELTAARDELSAALDAKEADIEAARASESQQVETLRSELEQARAERDELTAAIEAKDAELEQAGSERDDLVSHVEELTAAVEELTGRVEELNAERERAADEAHRGEDELAEARAAAEQARSDADRRQAHVDELAEALQEAQHRADLATGAAEAARGELDAAQSSAEDARLQAKGAIGELDEARRQVELFRGAFDTAPIGMALTAPDGRFVKVNTSLCHQLGYTQEQLLADDPPSIVHPDDVEANREMARRLIAGEIESSRAERRDVHADGHEIHMRESVALVRDGDDAPLLFIFQLEDATERIELDPAEDSQALGSASGSLPVPVPLGGAPEATPAAVEGPYLSAERVRQALEEDQFVLYCQPVLDLRSNEISQYELLIRMVDEDGRLILPQAFLKPAEQSGLIRSIDHWVVRRAIRLIGENRQAGRDVRIEVNVSPESLVDRELVGVIDQELAATPISPSNLVVEVTESAAAANIEGASALAKGVRGLGARFALDDFGSTFGSFRHLKDLPLDYLKIDGDLVSSLTESRTSQLVVKALVDVARGTGTETIAVFVSDDDTLMLLRQHGVGFAQGYVVGRPQPLSEVFADGRAALPPAG